MIFSQYISQDCVYNYISMALINVYTPFGKPSEYDPEQNIINLFTGKESGSQDTAVGPTARILSWDQLPRYCLGTNCQDIALGPTAKTLP